MSADRRITLADRGEWEAAVAAIGWKASYRESDVWNCVLHVARRA
jgi:hypothetical protein